MQSLKRKQADVAVAQRSAKSSYWWLTLFRNDAPSFFGVTVVAVSRFV